MPNPNRREADERPSRSDERMPINCYSCCRAFWICFTSAASFMFLVVGIIMLSEPSVRRTDRESIDYIPYYFFLSLVSILVAFHLYEMDASSPNSSRSTSSMPIETSSTEVFSTLLRRCESDGVMINVLGQAESTLSLPVTLTITAIVHEQDEESLYFSAKSTLSAEGSRETLDVEAGGSKKKAKMAPLVGKELGKATETLVKVVDETLYGKRGAEAAGEGSSGLSAEARRVVLQGVRQRMQSPIKPQIYVSSTDEESD